MADFVAKVFAGSGRAATKAPAGKDLKGVKPRTRIEITAILLALA